MTIETIIAMLNTIEADSYYRVNNNTVTVTIDDFNGFDEDWNEIEREYEDGSSIEAVLTWLEDNADEVVYDYYTYYHFGEIIVKICYSSSDI